MKIDGFPQGIPGITGIGQPAQAPRAGAVDGAQGEGFDTMFVKAMKEVGTLQRDAENQIEGLALGRDEVTPHGAMIALEKADIAFQLMTTIKSKIIQAYQEVMRTQV